jgi:uroporphyrin-3 C-methyltransferase
MNENRPDEPLETRGDAPSAEDAGTHQDPSPPDIDGPEPAPGFPDHGEEPPPSAVDEAPAAAPPRQRFAAALAFLALVVAIGAGGLAGYHWWTAREAAANREDQTAGLAASMRSASQALEQRVGALEQTLIALESEIAARQARLSGLQEQLGRVEDRLSGLAVSRQAEAAPERVPAIADAEHLLLVANRELALAGNHRVALASLKEADARLADLDDPSLLPVRQAIGNDIAAVEQLAAGDGESIALRLGGLAGRVQALPIKASLAPEPAASTAPADDSGWARFKRRLLELSSGLFRVRRVDQPAAPLMSPEEIFFLHHNVELDLKAARLAAMSGDADNYTESLRSARQAVSSFFLQEDPAVESFIAALDELAAKDIVRRWPDLSGTVELLRSYTEVPEAP